MTPLARRLGLRVPVVQAPMAGGPGTVALAAAASEAGALGSLPAGYLPVRRLRDDLAELRSRTSRPFAVNLFAPAAPADGPVAPEVMAAVNRLRAEVDLRPSTPRPRWPTSSTRRWPRSSRPGRRW